MTHIVEVDQSNKIEDSGDTFLAFSNGISWVIRIPFGVKQAGIQSLIRKGKPRKRAILMTFSAVEVDHTVNVDELLDLLG